MKRLLQKTRSRIGALRAPKKVTADVETKLVSYIDRRG